MVLGQALTKVSGGGDFPSRLRAVAGRSAKNRLPVPGF